MTEDRLRHQFGDYLGKAEVAVYSILAVFLALSALVTIASAVENAAAPLVFALLQCAMLSVLAHRDLRQPSGERPD